MTSARALAPLVLAAACLAQAPAPVGPHGGVVREAGSSKVELIIDRDGVEALLLDASDRPVEPAGVTGRVDVRFADAARAPQTVALAPRDVEGAKGLAATLRLGRVPEGGATVTVTLRLPGGEATLELPFHLARVVVHVCPMACQPAQAEPGACRRCRMDLVPEPYIYKCKAHPDVTSRQDLVDCWVCEARLERDPPDRPPPGEGRHGH